MTNMYEYELGKNLGRALLPQDSILVYVNERLHN